MDNLERENEVLTDPEFFEENLDIKEEKKEFNPRLILFFISAIAAVGLVFAVTGTLTSLKVPFAARGDASQLNANFALEGSEAASLLELQGKDTDLDGLSDYDELYVYKTSPYLPDSDSDGFNDLAEIEDGFDPNCPKGQECMGLAEQGGTVEIPGLAEEPTMEEIRQMLVEGGMTAEQVNAVDDETLRQLYLETAQETQNQVSSDEPLGNLLPDSYDTITPNQLRAILLDQGLPEEDLNNLSDSDLRELWNELLKEEAIGASQ